MDTAYEKMSQYFTQRQLDQKISKEQKLKDIAALVADPEKTAVAYKEAVMAEDKQSKVFPLVNSFTRDEIISGFAAEKSRLQEIAAATEGSRWINEFASNNYNNAIDKLAKIEAAVKTINDTSVLEVKTLPDMVQEATAND